MLSVVASIMTEFAALTGLSPATKAARRYLWTDAFAVCNFLELFAQTKDEQYRDLALALVDQVHRVLGRHREDDHRSGWISGLDEEEGSRHPTIGGLRIGKQLNERGPRDRFDDRLEWDRDGQYYHYLTKWMHALNRVGRVLDQPDYNRWAIELAKTAHARFTHAPFPDAPKRMYWKMSIDLSRPLVPSMGQHDPLDGLVTYCQLQAALPRESQGSRELDLSLEIADMVAICSGGSWVTDDPLGLGGLLTDAYKVAQLMVNRSWAPTDLLERLLDAAALGLQSYVRSHSRKYPTLYRLAFRELGLAIGLRAVLRLRGLIESHSDSFLVSSNLNKLISSLMRHVSMIEIIEHFWLDDTNRAISTWMEHRDINMVMLASSLAPDGYLTV